MHGSRMSPQMRNNVLEGHCAKAKTPFKGPRLGSCLEELKSKAFPKSGVTDLPGEPMTFSLSTILAFRGLERP